jgi:hypothetical protein
MECAPIANDDVVHCAFPPETANEPQVSISMPLSLKLTIPEGVPNPPVSAAVRVTAWLDVDGLLVDAM